MAATRSAATCYLAAGAQLDARFAEAVCEELLEPHRAAAPAADVDAGAVLAHAVAARRRQLLTDAAVTAVLLVAVLAATGTAVAVVVGLAAAVATWRMLRDLRRRDTAAAVYHGVVAVLAWTVSLGPVLLRSVEGYFSPPDPYHRAHLSGPQLVLALVLVLWAVLFASRVAGRRAVALALAGRDPAGGAALRDRRQALAEAAAGNVTVFAADAPGGPFVGCGSPVTAWSLAAPLHPRPAEGSADRVLDLTAGPAPALPDEIVLYARVREALESLGRPGPQAGRALPGLVVQGRLHVAGRLPAGHPLLLAGRPVAAVPAGILDDVARGPRGTERYYLTARTTRPDAGATLTCFVYLAVLGGMLFVELVQVAVPGVRARFRAGAGSVDDGPVGVLGALGGALADLVTTAPMAPVETGRRAVAAGRRALHRAFTDRSDRARGQYDYGARAGLRELAAEPGARVVDGLDVNEYGRVVERCLLDTLAAQLAEHGLDPAVLRDPATAPAGRPGVPGLAGPTGPTGPLGTGVTLPGAAPGVRLGTG